jgi:hypothetical protein
MAKATQSFIVTNVSINSLKASGKELIRTVEKNSGGKWGQIYGECRVKSVRVKGQVH